MTTEKYHNHFMKTRV